MRSTAPHRPAGHRPLRAAARGAAARTGTGSRSAAATPRPVRPVAAARADRPAGPSGEPPVGETRISEGISIKDLAERMDRKAKDIITRLFLQGGVMRRSTRRSTKRRPAGRRRILADGHGRGVGEALAEDNVRPDPRSHRAGRREEGPRPPVVTFMGHVDHGKTNLLDAIRRRVWRSVRPRNHQHIGAYKVKHLARGCDREIVFLDTPGHEAFTMMRSRGARVTDIVVPVVDRGRRRDAQTDRGDQPRPRRRVPLVVAVNKVDKAGRARIESSRLADRGVLVETRRDVVAVDFRQGLTGIDNLLEMILP